MKVKLTTIFNAKDKLKYSGAFCTSDIHLFDSTP